MKPRLIVEIEPKSDMEEFAEDDIERFKKSFTKEFNQLIIKDIEVKI